ncbi:DUF1232 domain-containing protein [Paenibacillus sp. LMG 31456]|uniref:DUF1232 domain-containing protein n=1 Tax=Paenibacillus foliorum TaxID=2654974 RepID=A0A972GWX4_9BACL|nr:YkvA family protein [Paenibacillus foliorum]NOU97813.1 DUF1232 domain-containing protein [Paenibacillus foliorum]
MSNYENNYSENSFWEKLKKHAIEAGKKVVYSALLAFYAIENPNVPLKDKMKIYGALGYLILPFDLVPDFIPVVGYGDDLAALLFVLGTIANHLDNDVKQKAVNKMKEWFGELDRGDQEIIEIDAKIVDVEKGMDGMASTKQLTED